MKNSIEKKDEDKVSGHHYGNPIVEALVKKELNYVKAAKEVSNNNKIYDQSVENMDEQ